ncbi:Plasmodium exported protein, unknown function [Plasmodium malariae]|uniref:Pv-fam-d protein n=1 Tax=Plasmodium malariae TaxID=5858 RepID=A0A1A8WV39_PLAMA|nr:Plasmodium exported protein, unknown function [Plasmodium malariae]
MMLCTSVKSWNMQIILNKTSNVKVKRLLYGEADVQWQKRYDTLKEKAMKIVDEDEYHFGNRLNTLLQNNEKKEQFKNRKYDKKVKKPSNSLKFKDNFEDSYNSLISDDYHKIYHKEVKEEPRRMKKYKLENTYTLPKISNFLKKLDKKYEKEIEKLADSILKKPNKYGYTRKISYKNVLNVCAPLIIASITMTKILVNPFGAHTNIVLYLVFFSTVIYVSYKILKKVKIFNPN